MSRQHPGFQYPRDDGGKYQHPWMKQIPVARANVYNFAHRGIVGLLMGASAYGFYEVGRGCYFVMGAAQQRARAYMAAEAAEETAKKQASTFWRTT